MENDNNQETIDNKYKIIEKKGHGASANVFCVKELNNETIYAAKVLKKHSDLFQKEINILKTLKTAKSENIINIIDSGEGPIISKNHPKTVNQYLILEYASKG